MASKRNGFTIVESLMAIMMLSLSGLAFSSFIAISAKNQTQNQAKLSVTQARSQILALIANRSVWTKNLKEANVMKHPVYHDRAINPELACLRDGVACAEKDGGYDLSLMDQQGNIVVDAIDTSKGLTREGAVCTGFSETTPNAACPWRLSLKWTPICSSGTSCLHPQVSIDVTVSASSEFLQSNNLTTTQVSLMLEQPKTVPTFARKIAAVTNSVHYGYSSTIEIDPAPYIVTESPGTITFSLPKDTSVRGATLSMNGQKLVYSPVYKVAPANSEQIYGTDWFNYTIKDEYSGVETTATVFVQVMTPYTWTGLAGAGDTSISNKKNFCGKVVNGVCDGLTFPGGSFIPASLADTNLIFNEVCTNCDVDIGTTMGVRSIELSPYYAGTIRQNGGLRLGSSTWVASTWKKLSSFEMSSGIWDGQSGAMVVTTAGENSVCGGCTFAPNTAFRLLGGTFKAPPELLIRGDIYMPNASAFNHNSGTVYWLGTWSQGENYVGSDEVAFYNFVSGYPMTSTTNFTYTMAGWTMNLRGDVDKHYIKNGFKVMNNLLIANTDFESSLNSRNPSAVVKLYGNLVMPKFNVGGSAFGGAPARVEMVGTTDQSILGQDLSDEVIDWAAQVPHIGVPSRISSAPTIVVNKPSGKLIMKDTVGLNGGLYFQAADSFDLTNVNLVAIGGGPIVIDLKNAVVDGLYYIAGYAGGQVQMASDLTVNKMFYWNTQLFWGVPAIHNSVVGTRRYINIKGDVGLSSFAGVNVGAGDNSTDATLVFNGCGDQRITSNMPYSLAIANSIIVEKSSGTLTIEGSVGEMNDFFVNSGTLAFANSSSGLHNVTVGANAVRTRISLSDPLNMIFPNIVASRTLEAITPVYTQNLSLFSVGDWIGPNYSNLYGGTAAPIYVSQNLSFSVDPNYFTPTKMSARSGTQTLILNGTGAQTIQINGENITGTTANVDIQVQNTSASHVTVKGKGSIGKLSVNAGATVDLDPASVLSVTGVVSGIVNKNGTSPSGTMTVAGGGVINN
jgi:Tfp pilus assembly protein PilV